MNVVAFANVKGGVGKTTSCANVAATLAQAHGRRVLLCDLDPQANLTSGMGVDPYALERSAYDVLHDPRRIGEAILPTAQGCDLLPSTLALAGAELELAPAVGRELRLRRALESLGDRYDFALIDTPPSLGLFSQNALMAARYVVVPVEPSVYSIGAMGQLQQMIDVVTPYNPVTVLGVLLTRYDARNRLTSEVERRLRDALGDLVFQTVIPVNVRAAEAPGAGQPVVTFAPDSSSARAYLTLTAELLYRIEAADA